MKQKPILTYTRFTSLAAAVAAETPGRQIAMIDAAAVEGLAGRLAALKVEQLSLYSGEDAVMLEHEAPYIVKTIDSGDGTIAALVGSASAAGYLMTTGASLEQLKRHWKRWLAVRLGASGERLLFRFFDPRICLAFLATLTPSDAMAFFGPVEAFSFADGPAAVTVRPAADTIEAEPFRFTAGKVYVMSPLQIAAMEQVADNAFRARLFRFFRKFFADEVARYSDEALRSQIDRGIQDADRMEDLRPGSVLGVVSVRVLKPEVSNDEFVWRQIMHDHPAARENPKLRAGIYEAYMTTEFETVEEYNAYYKKMDEFWGDNF